MLNSVSTLATLDFIRPLKPDLSDHAVVRIGRIVTVVFMVLAWALAVSIVGLFPTLFDYLQSFLAYVTPPVLVVFLGGIFWKGAASRGAFWTLAVGIPAGFLLWVLCEIAVPGIGIQFLYATGVLVALNLAAFVALSFGAGEARDTTDLMWTAETWRAETRALRGKPWYQNYRYLSVGLAVVTMAFVVPLL